MEHALTRTFHLYHCMYAVPAVKTTRTSIQPHFNPGHSNLHNSLIPTPTIVVTNASTKLDAWKGKKGFAFLSFLGKSSWVAPTRGRLATCPLWRSPDRRYLPELLLVDMNGLVWSPPTAARDGSFEVEEAEATEFKFRGMDNG